MKVKDIRYRKTMHLEKSDQNHSKILVSVGKPQLLPEQIFGDSHLALLDGCDLFPKGATISPKCVIFDSYKLQHLF